MLFNSYEFIFVFLPVVLAGCFVLARFAGAQAAQLWLTAASLYFYGSWNLRYLPLLLGSVVFNYGVARLLVRTPDEGRKRALILGAAAVNLALLGYYKYTNYFLGTVNDVVGTRFVVEQILLPLGISFYTFQQLTLLVDIGRGTIERFRFRDFLLFVTFYPHLIAGPIVHHREMMPQFQAADYRMRAENLAVGLTLFAVGLFKKAVLADGIANQVVPLYSIANSGQEMSLLYAWGAAVGFTLQMYFDFSGYSEMALGLGRMVGIKLPMNFNSPLKATSIIQYWSCWHITLTRFLTAYIYNPVAVALTRRRLTAGLKGVRGVRTEPRAFAMLIAVPTVVTMFLSGLWHGAGNQYLVFGLLHAGYLTVNHAWRLWRPKFWANGPGYARVMGPVGLVLTFLSASVALTYFAAASVGSGNAIVSGMVGAHGVVLPSVIANRLPGVAGVLGSLGVGFAPGSITGLMSLYAWMGVLLLIALVPPNILQLMLAYQPAVTLPAPYPSEGTLAPFRRLWGGMGWRPGVGWAVAVAAMTMLGILTLNEVTEFLYWQF